MIAIFLIIFPKIFFSVQVEARMRVISCKLEDQQKYDEARIFHDTADTCRLFRLYLESFLNPGVSAEERLTCMAYVLQSLRSMYNPWSMPPGKITKIAIFCILVKVLIFKSGSKYGTSYPLGVHRFTFTGLMNNLYLRIIMPSTIPNKTVHSRAIGTSQPNESDFAELSQMPQCTNGTPPALLIGRLWVIFGIKKFQKKIFRRFL